MRSEFRISFSKVNISKAEKILDFQIKVFEKGMMLVDQMLTKAKDGINSHNENHVRLVNKRKSSITLLILLIQKNT